MDKQLIDKIHKSTNIFLMLPRVYIYSTLRQHMGPNAVSAGTGNPLEWSLKHLEFFRNEVIKVDVKLVHKVCSQDPAIWLNIGMKCKEAFLLTNTRDLWCIVM